MENVNLDSIMSGDEFKNLFSDTENEEEGNDSPIEKTEEKETDETTEVDLDNLFGEPESVGSEEDSSEEREDTSLKGVGTSPKNNFYSSIAKALKDDGIFPDLDDESLKAVNTPEDFSKMFQEQVEAMLNEKQKRVTEALEAGIEPSKIQQYEKVLEYYDSIKESDIENETESGESLRKQLIYQDFLNRGFSKERAAKEVQKSFDAGTDVEDAKDAFKGGRQFFEKNYNDLVAEAKNIEKKEQEKIDSESEALKKAIMEDKKAFGVYDIDKATRQKVYDNITKPVYKDPETGELLTTLQKYERDNHNEFMKNLGLLYTLTDGFKNVDKLVNKEVNKKVSKGIRELEHVISGTRRDSGGNLKYASGIADDVESYSGKGWDIDL
jgi:hypothetical protein